jgi:hypothetical protein
VKEEEGVGGGGEYEEIRVHIYIYIYIYIYIHSLTQPEDGSIRGAETCCCYKRFNYLLIVIT